MRNYPRIISEIFGKDQNYFWARTICGDELVDKWLSLKAELPAKIPYDKPEYFVPRKVYNDVSKSDPTFTLFKPVELANLEDLIRKRAEKRIILLGVAGSGKSGELKNIANVFSSPNEALFPISCSFKNYVDHDFEEFISSVESSWLKIPEDQRLILLDGLDEVPPDKLETAGRKLNLFSQKFPNCVIVVSARSNFYKEQLEKFKVYYLRDLTDLDIQEYLVKSLSPVEAKSFERLANRNRVWNLFSNVFNLVEFVTLYKEKGSEHFPKSRTEAFELLIQIKIEANQTQHSVSGVDEFDYFSKMRNTLEWLAVSMEQLGVNHIPAKVYAEIISDKGQRELLKHSPLVHIKAKGTDDWQFEHNNYQEYLSAVVLAKQSVAQIKELIAFKPDYHKIKPKWINTLSFLMGILGGGRQ